jgi:RNase P subunit RPR2
MTYTEEIKDTACEGCQHALMDPQHCELKVLSHIRDYVFMCLTEDAKVTSLTVYN